MANGGPSPEDASLGELLGRLADEGKGYARAEIDYYRALLAAKLGYAKSALILGVIALVLIGAASIGLVVGLTLTLAKTLGPGWATLIVVGGTLLLSLIFGLLAWGKIKRLTAGEQ